MATKNYECALYSIPVVKVTIDPSDTWVGDEDFCQQCSTRHNCECTLKYVSTVHEEEEIPF